MKKLIFEKSSNGYKGAKFYWLKLVQEDYINCEWHSQLLAMQSFKTLRNALKKAVQWAKEHESNAVYSAFFQEQLDLGAYNNSNPIDGQIDSDRKHYVAILNYVNNN